MVARRAQRPRSVAPKAKGTFSAAVSRSVSVVSCFRREADACKLVASGCGAAWLARLLGVQEVPGSNPGSPTKFLKHVQPADLPIAVCGVQPESIPGRQNAPDSSVFGLVSVPEIHRLISLRLSPLYKTRQTRQIASKALKPKGRRLSGRPNFPTKNPTNGCRKPDIREREDLRTRKIRGDAR
jgi:hypothetical protein